MGNAGSTLKNTEDIVQYSDIEAVTIALGIVTGQQAKLETKSDMEARHTKEATDRQRLEESFATTVTTLKRILLLPSSDKVKPELSKPKQSDLDTAELPNDQPLPQDEDLSNQQGEEKTNPEPADNSLPMNGQADADEQDQAKALNELQTRGGLRKMIMDIFKQADTFLFTDEVLRIASKRTGQNIDKTVIRTGLKDARRAKVLVGKEGSVNGEQRLFYGSADFCLDKSLTGENGLLVGEANLLPEYETKFQLRQSELNLNFVQGFFPIEKTPPSDINA